MFNEELTAALPEMKRRALSMTNSHQRADDLVQAQLMVADIRRVCTNLREEDYSMLMSVAGHGFTHKEVAAKRDILKGTVLSRVSRAKPMIRETLGQLDETGNAS